MKKALIIGTSIGAALGAIIFAGYSAASWWVCSTLPDCPGHWLPYLVTFAIGTTVFTVAGAGIATTLRGLYNITRVDAADDPG